MSEANRSRLNLNEQHKHNRSRGHNLKSGRIQKPWVGNHQRDEVSLNALTMLCGVVAPSQLHITQERKLLQRNLSLQNYCGDQN